MIKFLHDIMRVDTMWYEWIVFAVTMDILIVGLAIINIVRDNQEEEINEIKGKFHSNRTYSS